VLIPEKIAKLLRKAEIPLFREPTSSKSDRLRVFYKLIRPLLSWIKEDYISRYFLTSQEAESELYLFSAQLFDKYNPNKSSIVPYLTKFIVFYKTKYDRKLSRQYLSEEIPSGLIAPPKKITEIQEEYYLSCPNFIFESRFLGKSFTLIAKYIITVLLTMDKEDLNTYNLSRKFNVSRQTMKKHLDEISEQLEELLS